MITNTFSLNGINANSGLALETNGTVLQKTFTPFVFTVDTTKAGSPSNQFVLPLISTGTYDFIVNWGDSTTNRITSYNQAEVTHTYANPGIYTIALNMCLFNGFQFNNAGDKLKLIGISQWGNVRFGDVYPDFPNGAFMGCTNLATITATDTPNFTGMTNLYACFRDCTSLVSINNIQNWDLSTITNLYGMFTYDTSYNDPNIGQLDVSGVANFSSIFFGCSNFNQDIGAWDTSNATSIAGMFFNCAKFNNGGSDSIKNWDTSKVTDMNNMFRGCTVFNQDISDWDTSNVTNMSTMFQNATNFINGNLAMSLPNKGTAGMYQYCQINVSPATYNGVTLSAASSTTDTNLKFYSSKTSLLAQNADNLSGKIRIVTVSDYPTLSKVRFTTTGTLPTNLSVDTDYWIVKYAEQHGNALTCPSYRIATSLANAQAGTFINYSSAGTGTHTVIEQDSTDGWVLGLARTQYYPNGYDNAGAMTLPASGKWYTRWVYRELSAANKNVFYVAGTAIYDSPEAAEAETERTDLPTHLTNNCVLVGRIIQQWAGTNVNSSICSVISRRLGATDGIGSWNVAKVTAMYEMFSGAKMFDIPLTWNAAACTDFYNFMYDCKNFNQSINGLQINPLGTLSGVRLKQWMRECRNFNNGQVCYRTTGTAPVAINLVGVGDCDSAFKELIGFNQNMDALNLSTATQLGGFMMYGMVFNNGQAVGGTTAPLLWSAVRSSHFQYMFADCYAFNQDISTLLEDFVAADLTFAAAGGVATITRVGHGLANGTSVVILGSSNETLLPNGTYIIANATTNTFTITAGSGTGSGTAELGAKTDNMFRLDAVFNRDLSKWNVSKVTNMANMFLTCTAFNNGANTDTNIVTGRSGLDGWDVGNVTTIGDMFNGATVFNRPLANWNVGKVTNMAATFKLTAFNQDIGNWNTVSVTTMGYMFNDCPFNQDIGNWNVSNCAGFQGMFSTIVPSTFDQDLSKWDVGKCVDFQYMFRRCFAFNNGANTRVNTITGRSGINGWNIGSNVATPSILMLNMFWSNTSNMGFNRNIGSWDTSKVTNISSMFRQCTSFNQDLSAWNTAQVTNMSETFYSCSALKQNFGAWNVTACTNFTSMFSGCNLNDTGTTTNYDALLVGWAAQAVQNSKSFHGGTSKYSATGLGSAAAGTGRAHLTAALNASPTPGHAWTITDGGLL